MPSRLSKRLNFNSKENQQLQSLLSRIDETKGYWEAYQRLSPQYLGQLKKNVLITSTGSSTRIEGSLLTDAQVEKLLREAKIRKMETRDEQEVAGYLELLQDVFKAWNSITFNEATILHFHKILLDHSDKDSRHKGEYKYGSNRVEAIDQSGNVVGIIFDPTPPHLVKKEMQELISWTQKAFKQQQYHSLIIIANFIFEYLAIHPFQDGNGRSSRILTNLLLLQQGYKFVQYVSHEKLIEERKPDYYLALKRTTSTWKTDKENITPWLFFFLDIIKKQGDIAVQITKQEDPELFLSPNQSQILECFNIKPGWSRKELHEHTNINLKTIEQSIKKLLNMNKIERLGQGRATRYRKL